MVNIFRAIVFSIICLSSVTFAEDGKTLDVESLKQELVQVAQKVQDYESRIFELDEELILLEATLAERKGLLKKHYKNLPPLLSALLRMVIFAPKGVSEMSKVPISQVHSSILIHSITAQAKDLMLFLQQEVADLTVLKRKLENHFELMNNETSGLHSSKQDLETLLGAMPRPTKKVKSLIQPGDSVSTLSELVRALPKPENMAKSLVFSLVLPVRGKPIETFGKKHYGDYSKGVLIETLKGAQVVSPVDGRVSYSGNFRGYGNLLIIDHGKGYYVLLTGIEKIYSYVGQELISGEPIGTMDPENKNKIYVEVRVNGDAIDPKIWLPRAKKKVT
ncbi:MAG: peptidoglycan DD-metalloendopeptidase family protein [Alphaproteobacteria bacterium]|nr:peptidoglycan DD-metalloendopeptidase family protein [Alphaproteobacteria bacterium]MBT5389624.1 peptidoglycan DD-metalloendopeptidase family protein [Alphaproteobacteria bacterium]MBT5540715.1 peptidoglycan DD-metalloendopeptidase family protein [Alphaproteobacteria bacterium]MBT5654570.1 peptidoglycan DD-metalloendopeptidase family protein [Alphaproteobacteria bacterium]